LRALACLLSFNPSYLSRMHREVTGIKLSDYICSARIEHAKGLLKHTNKSITQMPRPSVTITPVVLHAFSDARRHFTPRVPAYNKIGKED
jgi:two-component system response regulator YesN